MVERLDHNAPGEELEYPWEGAGTSNGVISSEEFTNTLELEAPSRSTTEQPQSIFELGGSGKGGTPDIARRHDDYLYGKGKEAQT